MTGGMVGCDRGRWESGETCDMTGRVGGTLGRVGVRGGWEMTGSVGGIAEMRGYEKEHVEKKNQNRFGSLDIQIS